MKVYYITVMDAAGNITFYKHSDGNLAGFLRLWTDANEVEEFLQEVEKRPVSSAYIYDVESTRI